MADREGAITTSEAVVSGEASGPKVTVVVHPLVLLSTVDHYNRVARDTKKRVVGVLLGTRSGGDVDVTNSFAVPFEEDSKNPAIWYLDHNYLETMYRMYKKVNAREIIVGFYSTGPKIKENDIKIDELVRAYCPQPVFVIIDVRPENEAIPTTAYVSVEEVESDSKAARKEIRRTFKHVSSMIGAYEAEEVGVALHPSPSIAQRVDRHPHHRPRGTEHRVKVERIGIDSLTGQHLGEEVDASLGLMPSRDLVIVEHMAITDLRDPQQQHGSDTGAVLTGGAVKQDLLAVGDGVRHLRKVLRKAFEHPDIALSHVRLGETRHLAITDSLEKPLLQGDTRGHRQMDMLDALGQAIRFGVNLGLGAEVEDLGDAESFDAFKVGGAGLVEPSAAKDLAPTGRSAVDGWIATEIPEVRHAVHRKQPFPYHGEAVLGIEEVHVCLLAARHRDLVGAIWGPDIGTCIDRVVGHEDVHR